MLHQRGLPVQQLRRSAVLPIFDEVFKGKIVEFAFPRMVVQMSASKLEESMNAIVDDLSNGWTREQRINLKVDLIAFALAVREPEGRCCDNGMFGEAHKCQKGTEHFCCYESEMPHGQGVLHECRQSKKPPEPNVVHICGNCPKCGPIICKKEPKECLCRCIPRCLDNCPCEACSKTHAPADLPEEAQYHIRKLALLKEIDRWQLEELARLCLGMRKP